MIIDFHSHAGKGSEKDVSMNKLLLHMKKNKFSKAVVFPFVGDDLVGESLKLLDFSSKEPSIIPFLRFDPKNIDRTKLESLLKKGFKGVKLHPGCEKFNPLDIDIDWVYETINRFDIPIIFHCKSYHFDPNSNPEKLLELAKRHPEQVFVFGHFAGVHKKLFKEFINHPNIYVETSIDVTPNAYREVVLDYGFDRLVFGTDFPFSFGEIELLKLKMAGLPEKVEKKILYDNAARLLNINDNR